MLNWRQQLTAATININIYNWLSMNMRLIYFCRPNVAINTGINRYTGCPSIDCQCLLPTISPGSPGDIWRGYSPDTLSLLSSHCNTINSIFKPVTMTWRTDRHKANSLNDDRQGCAKLSTFWKAILHRIIAIINEAIYPWPYFCTKPVCKENPSHWIW